MDEKVELRSKQGWRTEQGVRLERFHFELRDLKLCIQMAIPLHTGFHNQELAVQVFNKAQPFKSLNCFFSVNRETFFFWFFLCFELVVTIRYIYEIMQKEKNENKAVI